MRCAAAPSSVAAARAAAMPRGGGGGARAGAPGGLHARYGRGGGGGGGGGGGCCSTGGALSGPHSPALSARAPRARACTLRGDGDSSYCPGHGGERDVSPSGCPPALSNSLTGDGLAIHGTWRRDRSPRGCGLRWISPGLKGFGGSNSMPPFRLVRSSHQPACWKFKQNENHRAAG